MRMKLAKKMPSVCESRTMQLHCTTLVQHHHLLTTLVLLQPGFESKLVDHKQLIETKFAPAIALVKVLQITDSKAFVTAYSSLLEARWQNADAMQQALAVLDVTKDVAVTRLNMFRAAAAGGGGLVVRHPVS